MNIENMTIKELQEFFAVGKTETTKSNGFEQGFLGKFCIVRCRNAGVHAGEIAQINENFVELKDSRRLWRWKPTTGFTLSAVAVNGLDHSESKLPNKIPELIIPLDDTCEFIPCSDEAKKSIMSAENHNE